MALRASAVGLLLVAVLATCASAQAPTPAGERRVALVIGNARYANSPLRNPINDAQAMTTTLRALGFEVIARENVGEKDMRRAVLEFGDKLKGGGVGLFFYAGHGMQVAGRNYLIPIAAEISTERDVELEAVDVARVLARMEEAKNRLNIVILDACRDNPFARSFRSASRGLAQIDAPAGTLIAYATGPGQVAQDGDGHNGIYTGELLKAIREPGLKLEDVFKRVRQAVRVRTGGHQVPWEASSVEGDFVFALAPRPANQIATAGGDDVSGTFGGEISGTFAGAPYIQPITVTFVRKGSGLSGHWVSPGGASGQLAGEIAGNEVKTFRVTQWSPCHAIFTGSAKIEDGGKVVRGSYSGKDCAANGEAIARFTLARVSKDDRLETDTLTTLDLLSFSRAYLVRGLAAEGKEFGEKAKGLARTNGDKKSETAAVTFIGFAYMLENRDGEAIQQLARASEIADAMNLREEGRLSSFLAGVVHARDGRTGEALQSLERSRRLAEELGDRDNEARSLREMGAVHEAAKQYSEALVALRRARELGKDLSAADQQQLADAIRRLEARPQ